MRIVITGGAGFIGSHLVAACLERGHHVSVLDDLSTGSMDNIAWLQENGAYKQQLVVHVGTILNTALLQELIEECDIVFHLAAAVGVEYVLENPIDSIRTNVHGTENILELCASLKKRLLIASSSEVYGKHSHAPLLESDNMVYGPSTTFRWSYAASKLMGEFMSLAYFRSMGLKVTIARLFNTVGPRQSDSYGMVVPRLISQAMRGEPLTVYGDGRQTRTFTSVDDVVWALIHLVENKKTQAEVFNIGAGEEISILDLAQQIIRISKSSSQIKLIPYDVAFGDDFEDMQRRVPGIEKIKSTIGYDPQTSLESMLEKLVCSQAYS